MNQLRNELSQHFMVTPSEQENSACCQCTLPASFIGFAGHFPQRAILPAIAQMLMGAVAVEKHTGKPRHIAGIQNAKFLQPLGPDMCITTHCDPKADSWNHVSITLTTDAGVASSFTLALQDRPVTEAVG